jgi:hypothetical protein
MKIHLNAADGCEEIDGLSGIEFGKGQTFGATIWPTNEFHKNFDWATERAWTSQTIMGVAIARIADGVLTLICRGNAKIMVVSDIKALLLDGKTAGETDYVTLQKLDDTYNDY